MEWRWVRAEFVLLCLSLNTVELCNGGITSSYIRKNDISVDMPLDSDVFRIPPGYNAPQQVLFVVASFSKLIYFFFIIIFGYPLHIFAYLIWVVFPFAFCDLWVLCLKVHITQGSLEGNGVIVSWVTMDEPGSNCVLYWTEDSKQKKLAKGIVLTYKYFNYTSGYIHHCTIKDLKVSSCRQ